MKTAEKTAAIRASWRGFVPAATGVKVLTEGEIFAVAAHLRPGFVEAVVGVGTRVGAEITVEAGVWERLRRQFAAGCCGH
ncbi:MAG TPA: hypothetical protein VHB20_17840 [Verrucomicrobiae bacterium]|nr:hypothetical protein [Verrucomicrobiae bacterium]